MLRGKVGRKRAQKPTPGISKHDWARSMLADAPTLSFPNLPPPWSDVPPTYRDKLGVAKASQRKHLQQIKVRHTNAWTDSLKTYQNRVIEPSIAQAATLDKKRLKIHSFLEKAESALATQIRTGKSAWPTSYTNAVSEALPPRPAPADPCGWHRQTPEHVIMFCRLMSDRNLMFCEAGTRSYQALTESPKPLKSLTAWLMKSGILTQFSLAVQLLYQQ